MSRPYLANGKKFVVREQRRKARLIEETEGLDDCGKASYGRYVSGCRCRKCRDAVAAQRREQYLRKALGKPSKLVDAEPVRQSVRKLQEQGYTSKEIERLAGVPHSTMHGLMVRHWRTGKPVQRCSRELKDKVFSIKGQRSFTARQRVPAEWMAEQLQSYKLHGISAAEMARRIGCDRQTVDALLHGTRDKVRAETLHAFVLAKPKLDEMRKQCK